MRTTIAILHRHIPLTFTVRMTKLLNAKPLAIHYLSTEY